MAWPLSNLVLLMPLTYTRASVHVAKVHVRVWVPARTFFILFLRSLRCLREPTGLVWSPACHDQSRSDYH
jgi:hypothetical protein